MASWSMLIVGYCYRRWVQSAHELFGKIPPKNFVAWAAMINGYAQICSDWDAKGSTFFVQGKWILLGLSLMQPQWLGLFLLPH